MYYRHTCKKLLVHSRESQKTDCISHVGENIIGANDSVYLMQWTLWVFTEENEGASQCDVE